MNWTAYFQANGEHRHTIAVRRFKHTAEFEAERFTARMTNPEVGLWWVWVEETNENITGGDNRSDSAVRHHSAEPDYSRTAEVDSRDGGKS